MTDDPDQFLPLSPATLHILLALASGEMHGYGIMQDVLRQSEGRYKLGPGTLYDNLQRLLKQDLVEERRGSAEDDPRRRYYALSGKGQGVLEREIDRLERVLRQGKAHLKSLRPKRA